MTDTEAGYGTVKTRDDECVYMHVSDDDLWLTEEQVQELINEARKVVLLERRIYMTQGYGSVKTQDRGKRIYVEPSSMNIGGVFLDTDTQAIWLSEKQAKKLRKLIKEAIKAGIEDG